MAFNIQYFSPQHGRVQEFKGLSVSPMEKSLRLLMTEQSLRWYCWLTSLFRLYSSFSHSAITFDPSQDQVNAREKGKEKAKPEVVITGSIQVVVGDTADGRPKLVWNTGCECNDKDIDYEDIDPTSDKVMDVCTAVGSLVSHVGFGQLAEVATRLVVGLESKEILDILALGFSPAGPFGRQSTRNPKLDELIGHVQALADRWGIKLGFGLGEGLDLGLMNYNRKLSRHWIQDSKDGSWKPAELNKDWKPSEGSMAGSVNRWNFAPREFLKERSRRRTFR